MINKLKGFITGVAVTLVFTNLTTAFAQPVERAITAMFDNIKIVVDGIPIIPLDQKGNEVEPFIYNDTTYVPARAISKALGKEVNWDEDSKTVYIGENNVQKVTVKNVSDLLSVIGSNKHIILEPGVYDLTNAASPASIDSKVLLSEVYDGKELVLLNISNLIIEGPETGTAEITTTPRYANIIKMQNCKNVTIKNLKMGHVKQEYECDAGVLSFDNCTNITVDNNYIYGCGSEGISASYSDKMLINNCVITDCSLKGMTLNSSTDVTVKGTKFTANRAFLYILELSGGSNAAFKDCSFENNNKLEYGLVSATSGASTFENCSFANNSVTVSKSTAVTDGYMFLSNGGQITLTDCTIKNNSFKGICHDDSVKMKNCIQEGNKFTAK